MTVCNLPKLPANASDGAEVCDRYANRWQYNQEDDTWLAQGRLTPLTPVSEDQDGILTPAIYSQLQRLRRLRTDLRPLKISPGVEAYWYYLRSSDRSFRFRPEAENVLRIEVDRARLFQLLARTVCPGPRGPQGAPGPRGRAGAPAPDELCYAPLVDGARLDFALFVPTPLGERADISLPNDHVPDVSVRLFAVELPVAAQAVRELDPLTAWAVQLHQDPVTLAHFQATREQLVQQSLGGAAVACDRPLNRVLVLPTGATVAPTPAVTVLLDPTGQVAPRLQVEPGWDVDRERSLATLRFDPATHLACGSLFLRAGAWVAAEWCLKGRQRGPDGAAGPDGSDVPRLTECVLGGGTDLVATCPLVHARLDCLGRRS